MILNQSTNQPEPIYSGLTLADPGN